MQKFISKITLDLFQNRYVSINIAQYDINSRDIIATITNNGKPFFVDKSTMTARIKYLKSDQKKVIDDCEILDDGTVKISITDQMTISCCKNEAELMLIDINTQQVIHPVMKFIVNVRKAVFSDDEISSENEFIAFETALAKVDYLSKLRRITESEIDTLF